MKKFWDEFLGGIILYCNYLVSWIWVVIVVVWWGQDYLMFLGGDFGPNLGDHADKAQGYGWLINGPINAKRGTGSWGSRPSQ